MTFFEELKYRGVIKDISSPDLEDKLNNESLTFYLGTDPTADSLHIGHYASFVTAKRLLKHGHKPIILVGGATGLIGDPRPTTERPMISKETVLNNIESLKKQVNSLLDGKAQVVNNYDWTRDVTFLDFLRDIGKYINVNYMLNKDIISRRLDSGITYAEFSYTLLQGFDFLHLFRNNNCVLQAAGSDQWGNITTGIELIRKIENKTAYGFTMPLILDSTGKKFGKSEGNALWLDKEKTSPYQIYQYLINSDDSKVIEYLKVFTFLSIEEIESLAKSVKEEPEKRLAQKALAFEVVKDLHGEEEAIKARKISEEVFSKGYSSEGMPSMDVVLSENMNILDLLVSANIAPSKSEARRLVIGNGISINSEKQTNPDLLITEDLFNDNSLVISKGKKTHIKVNLVK
ncbi:tyrosine--tRNA ligase [Clostridium sp. CAG:1000]|jgi:tyrosyl-tRNA synthetase|nr:tyrosine--tRNA ligase [Clostridium sp. CAG:1000]